MNSKITSGHNGYKMPVDSYPSNQPGLISKVIKPKPMNILPVPTIRVVEQYHVVLQKWVDHVLGLNKKGKK